jgi:hypothetical protein
MNLWMRRRSPVSRNCNWRNRPQAFCGNNSNVPRSVESGTGSNGSSILCFADTTAAQVPCREADRLHHPPRSSRLRRRCSRRQASASSDARRTAGSRPSKPSLGARSGPNRVCSVASSHMAQLRLRRAAASAHRSHRPDRSRRRELSAETPHRKMLIHRSSAAARQFAEVERDAWCRRLRRRRNGRLQRRVKAENPVISHRATEHRSARDGTPAGTSRIRTEPSASASIATGSAPRLASVPSEIPRGRCGW